MRFAQGAQEGDEHFPRGGHWPSRQQRNRPLPLPYLARQDRDRRGADRPSVGRQGEPRDGGGGGGCVSYWRSGPIDVSPNIISIQDISDDQGGRVYLEINRSMIDVDAHPHGIDSYTIQRFDDPNWVNLGSFGGLGEKVYYYEALTLSDSSGYIYDVELLLKAREIEF